MEVKERDSETLGVLMIGFSPVVREGLPASLPFSTSIYWWLVMSASVVIGLLIYFLATRRGNHPYTTKTNAGELAGQALALQLSVDNSNAGVTRTGLAALRLKSGKLMGKTVVGVLNLANQVLGGNAALLPVGVSIKDLNDIVKKINENYENGTHDRGYLHQ